MDTILEYLPLLLPLAAAQLILAIAALVHVLRHPHYKFGRKCIWIPVVLLVQLIGPIIYFLFGKSDE